MKYHMTSEWISEIQKYILYRDEPQRVISYPEGVVFNGDHHRYSLIYDQFSDSWVCGCRAYATFGACSHSKAVAYMQRQGRLPAYAALLLAA